jgi:hypothetical protein
MMRWLLRYGAIRLVGRRVVPVLMVWDAAVLANKARQIPAVDRALRRSVAAAADRFADTLDNLTTGTRGPRRPASPPDEPAGPSGDAPRRGRGASPRR